MQTFFSSVKALLHAAERNAQVALRMSQREIKRNLAPEPPPFEYRQ
jgi:hypothetical protein